MGQIKNIKLLIVTDIKFKMNLIPFGRLSGRVRLVRHVQNVQNVQKNTSNIFHLLPMNVNKATVRALSDHQIRTRVANENREPPPPPFWKKKKKEKGKKRISREQEE